MKTHLTEADRIFIEVGLREKKSFAEIAREIGKNRSTVSREVYAHPHYLRSRVNVCRKHLTCKQREKCTYEKCKYDAVCPSMCFLCQDGCPDFDEVKCKQVEQYPYGCNACEKQHCSYARKLYSAKHAQFLYEKNLSESRKGIALSEEEFSYLDEKIVGRLKSGHSVHVICNENRSEMPVSERTIYSYLEQGLFSTDRLVLRRTVQRKQRKKSGPVLKVDKQCYRGRTYEDYLAYTGLHPEKLVSQMDSVLGGKGGKCLLTILFTNCDLQLMFLRERNTAESVSEIFARLRADMGDADFKRLFQVILTDRGSEFTDPLRIEANPETGERETRVFYCDPQMTNQKSNCERNHELIRYVIPKGKSMESLTDEKARLLMNHINSYPRAKWNDKSPIDVFKDIYGEELTKKLGLEKVKPESILLRPDLLK